jgi:hypothetical protein
VRGGRRAHQIRLTLVEHAAAQPASPTPTFWFRFALVVLACGVLYVGLRLSPLSYAIVLEQLEVEDTGLIAGTPRPERGDEFGWQTPLFQMAVRSNFQRFDRTPPYFEDLRMIIGLPVKDWAIVFRPQFWMFFVLPPSFAYSFHHFFLIAIFVVGFTILFARLGGTGPQAVLMALVLFFSSYMQYWWNGSANLFLPFFPWIVLAPLWNLRFGWRLVVLFWCAMCGVFTYFYPPNFLCLGFVGVLLWAAIDRGLFTWPRLLAIAGVVLGACGLMVFYLWEPLQVLAHTTYPGDRISNGGGVGVTAWLTQWLPTLQLNDHVLLVPGNICEASTLGSIYAFAVLFFVPWRELMTRSTANQRLTWLVLLAGLLATQAWMTQPLPYWVGYPLLWHRVPPGRMVVAGGMLLLVLTFLIGKAQPLRMTFPRAALLAAALFVAWLRFKHSRGIGFLESYKDWIVIAPVAAMVAARAIRPLPPAMPNLALLASALVIGAISFGTFNPLQSTKPIFERHSTPVTAKLDQAVDAEGRGFILQPWMTTFFSHTGLPLIGLGYPSLSYSTFDPAVDLWRKVFPDLPPEEFQRTFNNVGGFAFGDVPAPHRVPGTLVTLSPSRPFLQPGATVCDFIRPSRMEFAASVGCPRPRPAAGPGVSR